MRSNIRVHVIQEYITTTLSDDVHQVNVKRSWSSNHIYSELLMIGCYRENRNSLREYRYKLRDVAKFDDVDSFYIQHTITLLPDGKLQHSPLLCFLTGSNS